MRLKRFVYEFFIFGCKEAASCVFAGTFLLLLAVSGHIVLPGLARYDFLFLAAIAIQILLVGLRVESPREVAVLSLFHAIGMGLELFKTSPAIHSWSYPEPAIFRIATVPLYSGFMYAVVASYVMRAWHLFDLDMKRFPPLWQAIGLSALIYANFFSNHYIPDLRWPLLALVVLAFWHTSVHFTVISARRSMPLVLSFLLIGFFIWVAENVATFFGAWVYPNQARGWAIVGPGKITSWMLLVIISIIIVAALKGAFPRKAQVEPANKAFPPEVNPL